MRRRSRTRHVLKWAGTATCAMLVSLWMFTSCYPLTLNTSTHIGGIKWGRLWVSEVPAALQPLPFSWSVGRFSNPLPGYVPDYVLGIGRSPRGWRPKSWVDAGTTAIGLCWWYISVWPVFLAIAVPTAVLWWVDRPGRRRRSRTRYCRKCGYNLTGNVSGRCPECGTSVASAKQ